jgi:anaerobic selenocysteine-containing dehydrogenase
MERRVPGYCALCRSRCGAVAVVEGDKLLRVEPNPDHPTGAALCIKGRAGPEIRANPNRLLYPLKRTNPKTAADPGWQRISWDEALDTTASALRALAERHGPESVAFAVSSPSATPISDGLIWIERLINRFGSPNLCNGTELCNWHKDHAHRYTFGRGIATPDFARAECVLLWGHNPSTSWLDHATAVSAAHARGAALIVIDPRRAGFANQADAWLRVRPGTDAALALGLIGAMIRAHRHDEAFLRRWSNGPLLVRADDGTLLRGRDIDPGLPEPTLVAWDEAAGAPLIYDRDHVDYAGLPALAGEYTVETTAGPVRCATAFELLRRRCAAYPPEIVERITGVPQAQLAAAAELLARRPVAYYCWTGVGQHHNATQTDRAIAILMALTGSFDAPGGNVEFGRANVAAVDGAAFMTAAQRAKLIGAATRPLGPARFGGGVTAQDLYRAILHHEPYAVRGLVSFGTNLLVTRAAPERGRAALQALDFTVHADPIMNPTAALADIVLPVNTQWEREGLRVGFDVTPEAAALVQLRPQAVPSAGESRSDAWIVFQLAQRLGFGADFWNGDIDAGYRHHLAPSGISLEALRARPEGIAVALAPRFRRYAERGDAGFHGFDTPTRLVELYSEQLLAHGALPAHDAGTANATQGDYPLVLTSAKLPHYCHSQHRDIPSLRRRMPDPLLEMHPETARARGIADGAWALVSTRGGRARLRVKLNAALDPAVVCAQYGWWAASDATGHTGYPIAGMGSANSTAVVDDGAIDPISGSVTHRGIACDVAADAAAPAL